MVFFYQAWFVATIAAIVPSSTEHCKVGGLGLLPFYCSALELAWRRLFFSEVSVNPVNAKPQASNSSGENKVHTIIWIVFIFVLLNCAPDSSESAQSHLLRGEVQFGDLFAPAITCIISSIQKNIKNIKKRPQRDITSVGPIFFKCYLRY